MLKPLAILTIGMLIGLGGCESAYYNTMERFGVHKREILVDRVVDARDSQQDAQEQFSSALEQFKSVVAVEPGELEKVYDKLNREFERSEASAQEIRERIDAIESVADALFDEWSDELQDYTNPALRRDSEQQLKDTKNRYRLLLQAMHKAEDRLDPVLDTMRDQVLYLKHNLNARAIQSIRGEVVKINQDVDTLLAAMQSAIAEADAFVKDMRQ